MAFPAHGLTNYDDELEAYIDAGDAGSGGGPLNYALGSAASAGANSVGCERPPPAGLDSSTVVAIDPFKTICELKTIDGPSSGSTLSFTSPLKFAHSVGAQIVLLPSRVVPAAWFGARGDNSTNDHAALVHAGDESGREGIFLDGMNKSYKIALPWTVAAGSANFRNINLERHSSYAPLISGVNNDPSGAMLMNGTSAKAFVATAADDTFEFASAHGLAVTNGVVLYGGSLPAGVVQGKLYWVIQVVDTTRLKLSATPSGAVVNLTSDGSGEARVDVYNGGGRLNLENFRLDGGAGDVNGVLLNGTQPGYFEKPYIENCNGWGLRLRGQDYKFSNTVVIRCGRGIVFDGMNMSSWVQTNCETMTVAGTPQVGIDFIDDDGLHTPTGSSLGHHFFHCHFESCVGGDIRMAQGTAYFHGIETNKDSPAAPLMTCTGFMTNTSYLLEDVFFWNSGASDIAVDDSARGWTGADTIKVLDRGRKFTGLYAPFDYAPHPTPPDTIWLGAGKGYVSIGTAAVDYPMMEERIQAGQTVDHKRILDSTGAEKWAITKEGHVQLSDGPRLIAGTGSPEGIVSAPIGSLYLRSDGGASTTLYVKQSGTGTTGWVAK